jgi:hypothetical protein
MKSMAHRSREIVVLSAFALAALLMTWPLARDVSNSFLCAGPRADAPAFVWNAWNFMDRVAHGANPFFTDAILFPFGSALVVHTYAPLIGAAAVVIKNPVLALNVILLASFIISAYGGYRFSERFVHFPPASWIAGFIFAFSPYKLAHLPEHANLMLTGTIPLFLLAYLRAYDEHERHRAWFILLAVLCALLSLLSDYYYTYDLALVVALHWSYRRFMPSIRAYSWRPAKIVAVIVGVCVAGRAGLLILEYAGLNNVNALVYSADILSYLLPASNSALLGSAWVRHMRSDILPGGSLENSVSMGWTVLACAAYALGATRRKGLGAIAFFALAFLALSMPVVSVAGLRLAYLPTVWLHYIPIIHQARVPARFAVMVMLFVSVLGASGIRALLSKWTSMPMRAILWCALLCAVVCEYAPIQPPIVSLRDAPGVYAAMTDAPGALLEIPLGIRDGIAGAGRERTFQMAYQTIHHRPLLGGFLARMPDSVRTRFRTAPVISDIIAIEEDSTLVRALKPEQVDRFIADYSVRDIVFDPECTGTRLQEFLASVFGARIIERRTIDGCAWWRLR